MKLEIWSDIICPYCYIGKRKLERTLNEFNHAEKIEIEWKSFQLQPGIETQPEKNPAQHLAEIKGRSVEQIKQMFRRVTDMASKEGITFNMSKSVVANSFQAHRLLHFAQNHDKGNDAKEILLRAYFTEGKNIDDTNTLVQLAENAGLNPDNTRRILENGRFTDTVKQNILTAKNLGIRGVPFFLFDRRYAISGAQSSEVFKKVLHKCFNE